MRPEDDAPDRQESLDGRSCRGLASVRDLPNHGDSSGKPPETARCRPETSHVPARARCSGRFRLVFLGAGLISLLWFMVRVIPKPSRAAYPCQRAAAPLASAFVLWLLGVIGSALAWRRGKEYFRRSRHVLAWVCVCVAAVAAAR